MVAKLVVFSCLVAAAVAIAVPAYPSGGITYHQAPAPLQYAAPIAKLAYAPAPVQYAPAAVAKVAYAAPIAKYIQAEPEAPAQYEFSYSVHDTQTGDIKQQKEARNGDSVQGSYSLVQPDGVHRIVDYSSDKINGFNAVVRYEGQPQAPAKIAYAAPVAKVAYAPAPIQYAPAPVAKIAYAAPAPVAKIAYSPAPAYYSPAPVQYAPAPVQYAAAPVAKLAYAAAPVAKLAYATNLGHVSFSSPSVSYQH